MKNEHEAHGSGWLGVYMLIGRIHLIGLIGLIAMAMLPARAQWVTQTLSLKAGWNAVYLHVDASHETLQSLVGDDSSNPILEVWMWAPPVSTVQFVMSPQEPASGSQQWRSWNRNTGEGTLARLVGNTAYLVRVSSSAANYTWNIKGKPVAPAYEWTTTGLNFIGFPTPQNASPSWEALLEFAPELRANAQVFFYPGGDLGPGNPLQIYDRRPVVPRGRAYWIRSGSRYNRFFAPYELVMSGSSGVSFGDGSSAHSYRLRNLTENTLTVTLSVLPSESVPTGQPAIEGVPPLLLRGALDTTTLNYAFATLGATTPRTVTLAGYGKPGSDVEVVLGLNRSAMIGAAGSRYDAVLRMTDSLGLSQVDLPVTATVAATSGLWIGSVDVNWVGNYLPGVAKLVSFAEGAVTGTVPSGNPSIPQGANVPRNYSLRLIVHNPEAGGNAVLLQRVFYGLDTSSNVVVTTSASVLDPARAEDARRLSVTHLPWTKENTGWAFSSRIGGDTNLTAVVEVAPSDHASNPFLHTYHPDHDNLDPTFKQQLPQGMESYAVRREITLRIEPPQGGMFDIASPLQSVSGTYEERLRLTGLARAGGTYDSREFTVRGTFKLNRVAKVATLTTPSNP